MVKYLAQSEMADTRTDGEGNQMEMVPLRPWLDGAGGRGQAGAQLEGAAPFQGPEGWLRFTLLLATAPGRIL